MLSIHASATRSQQLGCSRVSHRHILMPHIVLLITFMQDQDNNDCMAYWLSNTSTLFFHLQQCLRVPSMRKPPTPTSFFGRMTQVLNLIIPI